MKNGHVKTGITRGYARDKKDAARLEAAGLRPSQIYRIDAGQTLGKFKMRAGEGLGVVGGFKIFGDTKSAIMAAIALIHDDWDAVVIDAETGQDSRKHSLKMMNAVIHPGQSPAHLEHMRKIAAEKRIKDGRMPLRQVAELWYRHPEMSVEDIVEVSGWPSATLYTKLQKRKLGGRRPKALLEATR